MEVIIIGAGMTGAMAAQTLYDAGVDDIIILEAADRVGGRIWNVDFEGYNMELGPNWYHGGVGNPVWELAQHLSMNFTISEYNSLVAFDRKGQNVTEDMMATLRQ